MGGLAVLAPVGAAHAQDAVAVDAAERRTDRARTLFQDGVALASERRWPEAEAAFREALENRDAPSIRFNLASALYEQGEFAEADSLARAAVAAEDASDAVRAGASEIVEHIAARAGYARVHVTGGEGVEVVVRVDGWLVVDPTVAVPLAPGAHVATAARADAERVEAHFEVQTGQHGVVNLALPAPFDAHAEGESDEAEPAGASPAVHETWWFWVAVGGGAAVAGAIIGASVAAAGPGVQAPIEGDFSPGVVRW